MSSLCSAIANIHAELDSVDAEFLGLDSVEKASALTELARAETRLTALRVRLMAVSGDVAADAGARDVAAWMATQTRSEYSTARADLELGHALTHRWTRVGHALEQGAIDVTKARIAVGALDDAAELIDESHWDAAEIAITEEACARRPRALRTVARALPAVACATDAEAAEGRKVESEEAYAARATRLSITPLGDGTSRIHAIVADAVATRLRIYLDSFTQPRRTDLDEGQALPRADRRRGLALGALLERVDPALLPDHGGDATTVIVTLREDQLRDGLGAAGLGLNAERLSVGEARRLACQAHILPAVLGANSEPLDLGRQQRLFTPAQRKAIRLRDGRCRAEGCDIEATWTEIHHLDAWAAGGATDVSNGVCLCRHHHQRIHDRVFDHARLPSGEIRFHRRA